MLGEELGAGDGNPAVRLSTGALGEEKDKVTCVVWARLEVRVTVLASHLLVSLEVLTVGVADGVNDSVVTLSVEAGTDELPVSATAEEIGETVVGA